MRKQNKAFSDSLMHKYINPSVLLRIPSFPCVVDSVEGKLVFDVMVG